MCVLGPDPDLHQARGQTIFHDPGERTGIRETITLIFVIQIRMRVEMQNTDRAVPGVNRPHDWISDRMIPAQAQRQCTAIENFSNMFLDSHQSVGAGSDLTIAQINETGIVAEIDAQFRCQVRRSVMHYLTNLRRRLGRPFHERRI